MKKLVIVMIFCVLCAGMVFAGGCVGNHSPEDVKTAMDMLNSYTVTHTYAYGANADSAETVNPYSTTKVVLNGNHPGSMTTYSQHTLYETVYNLRGASFMFRNGVCESHNFSPKANNVLTFTSVTELIFADIQYTAKNNKGMIEYRYTLSDDFVKDLFEYTTGEALQGSLNSYHLTMKAKAATKMIQEAALEISLTHKGESLYFLDKAEYSDYNSTFFDYPAAIFDLFETKTAFEALAAGLSSIPTYKASGNYTYRADASDISSAVSVETGFTRTQDGNEYSRTDSYNNTRYLSCYKDGKRYQFQNNIFLNVFEQQTLEDTTLFFPDLSGYRLSSVQLQEETDETIAYYVSYLAAENRSVKIRLSAFDAVYETTYFSLLLTFEKNGGKLKKLYFSSVKYQDNRSLIIDLMFIYNNGGAEIPALDPDINIFSQLTAALDRFADRTDFYSVISVTKDGNSLSQASGLYHRGDENAPLFAMFTSSSNEPDGYYYYDGKETVYQDGFLLRSGAVADIDADYASLDFLTILTKTPPSNINRSSSLRFEMTYPEGTAVEAWTKARLALTGNLMLISASLELFPFSEVPKNVALVFQDDSSVYNISINYLYSDVPVYLYLPDHIHCGLQKSRDSSGNTVYTVDCDHFFFYSEGGTLASVGDCDRCVRIYNASTLREITTCGPFETIKDVQLNGSILSFVVTGHDYGADSLIQIDMTDGRYLQ